MTKVINRYWSLIGIAVAGLILAMIGLMTRSFILPKVSADTSSTTAVNVSATVSEWLAFSISTSTVQLTPDLVDIAGGTHIGSSTAIDLSIGTNASNGWSTTIKGANSGLVSGSNSIASTNSTSTLVAGTDGYGVNATSTLSGVTVGKYYDYWNTNTVGGVTSTEQTLVSKATSNDTTPVAEIKIMAACDKLQPPGTYSDTITLTTTSRL